MNTNLIGVLGAGQLGRMLALAGYPLGLRFRFLDPSVDAPAGQLAEHHQGAYDDPAALAQLCAGAHVITYEFENVPVETVRAIEPHAPVFPPPAALEAAQDRLIEKRFFQQIGAPVSPFAPVGSQTELDAALAMIGVPAILKTRRLGYDGKGQAVIRTRAAATAAWAALGVQPLILEGFVDFTRELSIIAARGRDGATTFYPLIENQHHAGILRQSIAPAPMVSAELQAAAEGIARRALDALDYVGVLTIELFEVDGGRWTVDGNLNHYRSPSAVHLLVNEMAPRVHNSGHWTIEGAETSQFENHLRAITGLPLGATTARGHSVMLNLIGSAPNTAALLNIPGAHVHLYGKSARPGRKIGHVTIRVDDQVLLAERVTQVKMLIDSSA